MEHFSQDERDQYDARSNDEEPKDTSPPERLREHAPDERSECRAQHRADLKNAHKHASFARLGNVGHAAGANGNEA